MITNIQRNFLIVALIMFVGMFVSCSKKDSAEKDIAPDKKEIVQQPAELLRNFSVESITRGAMVFQQRCAECHGPQAQGHPGWSPERTRNNKNIKNKNNTMVVAPPLDGTGIAHKRKKSQLVKVIKQGIKRENVLVMPDLEGRLSAQDIEDVITWFQALWPPKVYEAWNRTNQATTSSKRGS